MDLDALDTATPPTSHTALILGIIIVAALAGYVLIHAREERRDAAKQRGTTSLVLLSSGKAGLPWPAAAHVQAAIASAVKRGSGRLATFEEVKAHVPTSKATVAGWVESGHLAHVVSGQWAEGKAADPTDAHEAWVAITVPSANDVPEIVHVLGAEAVLTIPLPVILDTTAPTNAPSTPP